MAGFFVTLAVLAAANLSNVDAFGIVRQSAQTTRFGAPAALRMSDAQPSDSSSDDLFTVTDVQAEEIIPTDTEAIVSSVLDELPSFGPVSRETRANINEALYQLEALNPEGTKAALSPLLNGVWELRYAGGYSDEWALPSPTRQVALFLYSGGYSPGIFALTLARQLPSFLVEVGELTISISREQPRIEARVDVKVLGGSDNEVVVKARLDVESGMRFTETYESATVLGNTVDVPEQLQYSRELFVTYVDEDILVVRDSSGVPEVLVRK